MFIKIEKMNTVKKRARRSNYNELVNKIGTTSSEDVKQLQSDVTSIKSSHRFSFLLDSAGINVTFVVTEQNQWRKHSWVSKTDADGATLYDYVFNQGYMFMYINGGLGVPSTRLYVMGKKYEDVPHTDDDTVFNLYLYEYTSGLVPEISDGTTVTATIYKPNYTKNPNAYYSLRHMIEHPRLATVARESPARGDVYVNDAGALLYYSGSEWRSVNSTPV